NVSPSQPRHALNDFKWQLPSTLPPGDFEDPPSLLSAEPHSFSRVFTGCFYDTLTGIFAAKSRSNTHTLLEAAQTSCHLLRAATRSVPERSRVYRDVGRAMVLADQQQNAGENSEIIGTAFANHGLALGADVTLFPETALDGSAPAIAKETVKLQP